MEISKIGTIIIIILLAVAATVGWLRPLQTEKSMVTASLIPESAKGLAIDPGKGYFVGEIRDGLYWVTEGAYQVMFLTTGEGVIVVDAPPSIGQNILAAIAEVTDETITHVIYSHSRADHIAAAGLYPPEATVIAHAATAAQLEVGLQNESW